ARGSGLDQRYVILGATVLFTTYLCLSLNCNRASVFASWALLLTGVVLLPWNAYNATDWGQGRRAFETDLVDDIRAGVSADLLGTRYYEDLWGDPGLATDVIKQMSDYRLGPFALGDLKLNDSQPVIVAEDPLPIAPASIHNMHKVGDYWQASGPDSYLVFSIEPTRLAGVRLEYSLTNPTSTPALLRVAWSDSPRTDFETGGNRSVRWGARADGHAE